MLESLEQSNIKRMTVETEKGSDVKFDPERDIAPEIWKGINLEYIQGIEQQHWQMAVIIRSEATIMSLQDKLLPLSQRELDFMRLEIEKRRDDVMYSARLKIIDPTINPADRLDWLKICIDIERSY
jgi:hypothetical protein